MALFCLVEWEGDYNPGRPCLLSTKKYFCYPVPPYCMDAELSQNLHKIHFTLSDL